MKQKRITPDMQQAINDMKENDGKIFRFPGGFWSTKENFNVQNFDGYHKTVTVEALVNRGLAKATKKKKNKQGELFAVEVTLIS